jgi:hypothetical protein
MPLLKLITSLFRRVSTQLTPTAFRALKVRGIPAGRQVLGRPVVAAGPSLAVHQNRFIAGSFGA